LYFSQFYKALHLYNPTSISNHFVFPSPSNAVCPINVGEGILVNFGTNVLVGPEWGAIHEAPNYASQLEDWGYDSLWCTDERFERDVYVTLSLSALKTRRVKLGTCVTNPYLRHPLMTATGISTVNDCSNGRAVLGVGAGASAMFERQGITRPFPPVQAIRETVEVVRAMTSGKVVDYEGKTVKFRGANLDFKSKRVPVYIASRGPKLFQLAGGVADGIIIGSLASRTGIQFALENVRKGAKKYGRDPKEIDVIFWAYTSMLDDEERARQQVKSVVISSMWSSRSILKHLGVGDDVWKPIEDKLKKGFTAGLEPETVYKQAYDNLPNKILDAWSVTGTPERVAMKVKEIIDAGVNQIALLPFAETEIERRMMQRRFAEIVIPQFK
jgi:5,10-methylenetetrahydromethanopterin reductase